MNVCKFCNKSFVKIDTLQRHVCEKKRRFLAKDEKHVQLGLQSFVRFFQLSVPHKKEITYDDFVNSPYYISFVKFGSFLSNTKPLYMSKFIDWVIKSGVKIDHWSKDELYEKYVNELIRTESVETALERAIIHMQEWATKNKSQLEYYFQQVKIDQALYDISDGKISPWVLLNTKGGKLLLNRMSEKQLKDLYNIIDPIFWSKKFKANYKEVELVQSIAKEAKI